MTARPAVAGGCWRRASSSTGSRRCGGPLRRPVCGSSGASRRRTGWPWTWSGRGARTVLPLDHPADAVPDPPDHARRAGHLAVPASVPAAVHDAHARHRWRAHRGREVGPVRAAAGVAGAHGTVIIGAGVAVTGIAMLIVLGGAFLDQPWLLVALAIYATVLAVAFFIQRPGVRRLLRSAGGGQRGGEGTLALPGAAAALHQLPDGRRHRHHRLAHDEQAHVLIDKGAEMTDSNCLFCRIVAGEIPRIVSTRTSWSSPSTTSTRSHRSISCSCRAGTWSRRPTCARRMASC